MPYVSRTYQNATQAPDGKWVCAPTSSRAPYESAPSGDVTRGRDLCGQCVSYVKAVCPELPATSMWRKGDAVKGRDSLRAGTVIATFNAQGRYEGHAAIYVGQISAGLNVIDQWVSGSSPKPVGPRLIRFGGGSRSNDGDQYHVVE